MAAASGDNWKRLAAALGGAAVVGVVAHCALRRRAFVGGSSAVGDAEEPRSHRKSAEIIDAITKEQVQDILQEIIKAQEQMKGCMKDLTQELLSSADKLVSFEHVYEKVKRVQPADPLDKYELSTMDFDRLLDKHQGDPGVRDAIKRIMGAPAPGTSASDKVQVITVSNIIDVHKYLLEELDKLVDYLQPRLDKNALDMKTVTIAAQAIVGSKIESKFGITSEDVESAVLMYHTMLATDQEFATINIKIQHTMGKLMGTPFSPHT